MSYREIKAAVEAFRAHQKAEQERSQAEMQIQAVIAYRQAHLIGAIAARVLGDRHKVPSLEEAFPGFFPEEMLRPRQQDWKIMKARIEAYSAEWKRKRGEQQRDDRRAASADHGGDETTTRRAGEGTARATPN